MRWLKKLAITAVVASVIAVALAAVLRQAYLERHPTQPVVEPLPDALIVFCFHGNVRDKKCKQIEEYTHEVLEKSFAKPLKDGTILWQVLNYEDPKNARFKNEYQVNGSCIVLSDARSGRPGVAKNLQPRIMQLLDKDKNKDADKNKNKGKDKDTDRNTDTDKNKDKGKDKDKKEAFMKFMREEIETTLK